MDLDAAREVVSALAVKLSLSLESCAEAILALATQNMAGRTRLLSIEQGLDPRDFAFVCFGGAGPLHGAAIMREVGVPVMIIPPQPGVLCAQGCTMADIRYDAVQSFEKPLGQFEPGELDRCMLEQRQSMSESLEEYGVGSASFVHLAQMSYTGQIHSLAVALEPGMAHAEIGSTFEKIYSTEFGSTLDGIEPMIVNLQTAVLAPPLAEVKAKVVATDDKLAAASGTRPVYFGGWRETPIYSRASLAPGAYFDGPAIVEQLDCTCVIEPAMTARVDSVGNIIVERS